MDAIDKKILEILQDNGKISNAKLAELIGMAPSTTLERVRRLEEKNYIKKYTAILDHEKLGYNLVVIILITLTSHQENAMNEFIDCVVQIPEVLECYTTTGRFDYILKAVVQNKDDLERVMREKIARIPAVARAETLLVLKTHKETNKLNIPESKKKKNSIE